MDIISSIITTIGDFLHVSSWYPQIQWTFWTLLVILAFCGVYTARFKKQTLLTLATEAVLKLTFIYMLAIAFCIVSPTTFSRFPFFSITEEAVTLVNPLNMLENWDASLPRLMVRLYALLYFINIASIVIDYKPVNFVTWGFFQFLVCGFALVLFFFFHLAVHRFWPGSPEVLYKVLCVLLLLGFSILLALKITYTVTFVAKKNNLGFQKVYQFLTNQNFGKQFTVTALAFLFVVVYLVVAAMNGHSRFELDSINIASFLLNMAMCGGTLYIFSKYFNG